MTDKELRKLSRAELLEMLLEQSKEAASLREQLEEARAQLQSRQLQLEEAGNLADAALRINGVFQAAQEAAEQYLENIRQLELRQEALCEEAGKTRAEADKLLTETQARCSAMEKEIEIKYSRAVEKFRADAQRYWEEIKLRKADEKKEEPGNT